MKRLPRKDTSHNGMLCIKPTSSMALTISPGRLAEVVTAPPMLFMDAETTLPQMEKMAVMISIPRPTATLASTKRMKCRRANSGLCSSLKDAAEEKMPIAKKSTSNPYPIPVSAELMLTMTLHICPPLNVSGVCVMSCHNSASLPFHVAMARSRFLTTQLSLMVYTSLSKCNYYVLTLLRLLGIILTRS